MSLASIASELVTASESLTNEKAREGVVAAAKIIAEAAKAHDAAIDKLKGGATKEDALALINSAAAPLYDLKTIGAAGQYIDVLQQLPELFFWPNAKAPVTFVKDNREVTDFKLTKLQQASADNRPWAQAVQKILNGIAAVAKDNATGVMPVGGNSGAITAAASTPSASSGEISSGFEKLPQLTAAHESLAPLKEAVAELAALAKAQDTFLAKAATQAKPADVSPLLSEMSTHIGKLNEITEANERHKTLSNHFQAIGAAATIFTWVCVDKPMGHCDDNIGILEVFVNKIYTQYKGQKDAEGEAHMAWAREFRAGLNNLVAVVKKDYRTGPTWGAGAPPSAPTTLPGKKGGPAPPPPPPPPPAAPRPAESSAKTGGGDMSAMFAEISGKGVDISKMLKHVKDEDKAYKQKDREVRTVSEEDMKKRKAARKGTKLWTPKTGTPKMELENDKRWVIEYQGKGEDSERQIIEINEPQMRHMIFISACNNVFVKINGKVNSVQIIESLNVQVQLSDTVGPVEVTGSERAEILITGNCPSVIAGKVNGLTIHLAGSLSTELVTSCATGVNVTYPIVDADGDKDTVEVAVSEQFMSKIGKKNKIVSTVVTHGE